MEEGQEGNPLANIQKTVRAQQERIKELEGNGLIDELKDPRTTGNVRANYQKGQGGWVETLISSGGANFKQSWNFDAEGKLSSLSIYRGLEGNSIDNANAGKMVIQRDINGKLVVTEFKVSSLTAVWQEAFAQAGKRDSGSST